MTITTSSSPRRHLALVADLAEASQTAADMFRLTVAYATGTPMSGPIPADVADQLDGLDALAETAQTVFDLACEDWKAAQVAIEKAAHVYAAASDAMDKAAAEVDTARRACIAARKTSGVVLTATGYRRIS